VYRQFDRRQAIGCLQGKWLHMDGDSLTRDQYYDLLELVGGQSACAREKSHQDQAYKDDEHDILITLGFNPALQDVGEPQKFEQPSYPNVQLRGARKQPDFWVWSAGLWFDSEGAPDNKTQFVHRLKHVALSKPHGTVGVLRNSALYLPQRMVKTDGVEVKNKWQMWLNTQAASTLETWPLLDVQSMVQSHPRAISNDGIHCSGVVSKTVTNVLLNQICT